MSFAHPKVLWLAAIGLPLLALFLWATWRKRQALIRQFVQNKTLAQMTLGTSTARLKLRRVILFLGVAVLLFTAPATPFTVALTYSRLASSASVMATSYSTLLLGALGTRMV